MGAKMKPHVIVRTIEVCPVCGGWNPFRRGHAGASKTNRRTGTRRIYGECKHCGTRLVLRFRLP